MNAVKALNVTYNPHNIFFKYIGYDVTNNSQLTNHQISYPASLYNPEAFNIFFANAASTYSAYAIRGNTKSVFSYGALNGPHFDFTICHEIGHCLNLLHTFQNAGAAGCEHVTRNPADPNYNATTAGDQVADTPAQPQLGWSNFTGCNYNYNPANTDCQGTPYQGIIRSNVMGYDAEPSPCFHLTPGQVIKIKQYLENPDFAHYSQTY